jgi:hypothetical protein
VAALGFRSFSPEAVETMAKEPSPEAELAAIVLRAVRPFVFLREPWTVTCPFY